MSTDQQEYDNDDGSPVKAAAAPAGGGALTVPQYQMMPTPTGLAPGSTIGISDLKLRNEEKQILRRALDPKTEISIRPDGIVYVPGVVIRNRMMEAFGPGEWALRVESPPGRDPDNDECTYDASLWVHGKFVSRALGGCRWRPGNAQMTKSDALEGARTDCLHRCAKDLGIGTEVWDRTFILNWIAEYAEPYTGKVWSKGGYVNKVLWRKKGEPLFGEALNNAVSIAGQFPVGFGPDTPIPEGPNAGKAIKDLDEAGLNGLERASLVEWRLAAKAEKVRRMTAAIDAASAPTGEADGVDEILAAGQPGNAT